MYMSVDTPSGDNFPFACDHLCTGSNHDCDARLDVRVPCLPDSGDAAIFNSDVRFQNPRVIDDYGIRNNRVDNVFRGALGLAHAVPDHFAATKLNFFSVNRKIVLDLDEQLCIGKSYLIACGGTKHFCVSLARDFHSLCDSRRSLSELAHDLCIKSVDNPVTGEFY